MCVLCCLLAHSLDHAQSRPVIGPLQRLLRIDKGRGRRSTIDSDQMAIQRARAEGKLRSKVFGPLLAELTVEDPQAAVFVEEIVGSKWATVSAHRTQRHDDRVEPIVVYLCGCHRSESMPLLFVCLLPAPPARRGWWTTKTT